MMKKLTVLVQTILFTSILILPWTASAMTIDEYYYPVSEEIQFAVHQTEGNIAGFAVASHSLNYYSGTWIENAYGNRNDDGPWVAFKIVRDGDNNWVDPDGNRVEWLDSWGKGETYAFVYCDSLLNSWYDYTQNGTVLPSGEDPPTLTYLSEETVSGWWATAGHPYSPFTAIRIGDEADISFVSGETTEHVVPIPAAAFLFGSGLIGLLGMRRRLHT
jgi:hypothetical protein